ncbi:MAG: creatininase family protein [Candidatus Heimdallarchaeota archaeon]|nr:creatininase family protein [Candidatus Heimdallarchaeota archaeon]
MVLLENISYEQAKKELSNVFVLPVGSTEQHGPQCPLGTDYIIAETLTRQAVEQAGAVCLPSVPFGVAAHHRAFPGTIFIREETLKLYVKEILESLIFHGVRRMVVSNGHGGNTGALSSAIMDLRIQYPDCVIVLYEYWKHADVVQSVFGDGSGLVHACGIETSMIHACREGVADLELAKTLDVPKSWGLNVGGQFMHSSTHEFSTLGPVGDMSLASAEKGESLKKAFVNHLSGVIKAVREYSFHIK